MKQLIVLILVLSSFVYFVKRSLYLIKLLSIGRSENRFDQTGKRLFTAIKLSLLQLSQFRVKKSDYIYAGVMHVLIIFGFIVLLPGEIEFILNGLFPEFDLGILGEPLFNIFLLSQDLFAFLVIVSMALAMFRRLVLKPKQINYHLTAYLILTAICLLMLTIFGMNIIRIGSAEDPFFTSVAKSWMPITNYFVEIIGNNNTNTALYEIFWWVHLLVLLLFIDYVPNSKHLHVFTAVPANYFKQLPPLFVNIPEIDFEAEDIDNLGISKIEHFTWKQLFEGYACTECGRCTDQCPANTTGKSLSPKDIILAIRDNLFENGRELINTAKEKWPDMERTDLIGQSICEEELWQCTTCGACINVCPVGNEHFRDIIEMRRHLVMEEGQAPEIKERALKYLETRSHPFYGTGAGKEDWKQGLDVPLFEKGKTEYLLWVGCSITFEERAQNIARAMVGILQKAEVSFGVLDDLVCCGDPGRQMGNEFLFQELRSQNQEEFESLGVKKIITMCPHCYNMFFNYYGDAENRYEVIHHSTLINTLISSNKIKVQQGNKTICYHDPCYLARYHNILEDPRTIISKKGQLIEMPRHGKEAFCCGGGGGNYWAEEEGERISNHRAKEAFDVDTNIIATACPFCLLMLTDGLKNFTEEQKVMDIAEIIDLE
jgi:Fe-S oxidoreductase